MEKECHFLANMLFHTTCVLSSMFYLQCQQTGHKLIGFVTKRGHRFWRPGAENLQNDGSGLRTPHCGSGTCKKTTISWRSIGASFSNWWLVTPLNLPQLGVKILKNIWNHHLVFFMISQWNKYYTSGGNICFQKFYDKHVAWIKKQMGWHCVSPSRSSKGQKSQCLGWSFENTSKGWALISSM